MDLFSMSVRDAEELAVFVEYCGFLPLFRNEIPGFSVEEHTPPNLWFADDVDGPWEWKGPVIRNTGCAYGKLFRGKQGKTYGWGVARYATPERFFGSTFTDAVYIRTPEQSKDKVTEHLKRLLPHATGKQLEKLLKGR